MRPGTLSEVLGAGWQIPMLAGLALMVLFLTMAPIEAQAVAGRMIVAILWRGIGL